jgi:hypothetical protein
MKRNKIKFFHYLISSEKTIKKVKTKYDCIYDEILGEDIYPTSYVNTREVYLRSYDQNPTLLKSIYDLNEIYEYESFKFFDCEYCNRTICEQNPNNGWETQYQILKIHEDYPEQICNDCIRLMVVKQDSKINNPEFIRSNESFPLLWDSPPEGWQEEKYVVIKSPADYNEFLNELIKLTENGFSVYVKINSMAIGGLEGGLTVYKKKM